MNEAAAREQFRAEQRAAWDSVADGWKAWWSVMEAGAQGVNDRLVELAGVAPGNSVLDVATGIGEPALTAARRVGGTGRVVAVDLSPGMLGVARERAAAAGLGQVEFRNQDVEQLGSEDAGFDAALCRWGLMLMRDPVAAAAAVARLLAPGRTLAAAVWGEPEQVPFLSLPRRVLHELVELPAFDPDAPGPCRLGRPGQLASVLEAAGLEVGAVDTARVRIRFASGGEFARFLGEMSSTTRKVLDGQPEDVREVFWSRIAAVVEKEHGAASGVELDNLVWLATGTRG